MASKQTSNYGLSQWERSDKVLMEDFNADNVKIDAAVKAVDRRVDSVSATVSGKASQTALDSLKTTVGQHTTALAKLGNCLLYAATYVGTGYADKTAPTVLSFPHKPMVVFVSADNTRLTLVQGSDSWAATANGGSNVTAVWSGKSVQWTTLYDYAHMNNTGKTYSVVALLDAGA